MTGPEFELRLLGGLIVSRSFRRHSKRLSESMFVWERSAALFLAVSKFSMLGFDDTLQNYVFSVANYMRDAGHAGATKEALLAFEAAPVGTTVDQLITDLIRLQPREIGT